MGASLEKATQLVEGSCTLPVLIANALLLGLGLVALWAIRDFHRDVPSQEIRYTTERDRYWLAIALYIGVWLLAYFLMTQILLALENTISGQFAQNIPPAMLGALAVVALTESPGTKGLADKLRQLARLVALYPIAARRLQQQLTAATFETDSKFREVLNHEINRFGASIEELEKQVSPAVIVRLCEVQAVRDRLRVIAETPLQEGSWTFCRFVNARQLALASAEQRYRRLIRRAARICILGEGSKFDAKELYPLSEFVARGAESLLQRYRALIAEAALSCFPSGRRRQSFIGRLGYVAPRDLTIPYWPLLIIFVVDLTLFLIPIITHSIPVPPPALLLTNAAAQVVAVAWAIFPKGGSNFARPSLYTLPWQSYLLYGCLSYVSGVLISLPVAYANPLPPGAFPIHLSTTTLMLLFSVYFPVVTVTVSFLTDLHLRPDGRVHHGRLWDACICAAAMVLANLIFRLGILAVTHFWLDRWIFALILGMFGAVIGALIPATAASYLEVSEMPSAAVQIVPIARRINRGRLTLMNSENDSAKELS